MGHGPRVAMCGLRVAICGPWAKGCHVWFMGQELPYVVNGPRIAMCGSGVAICGLWAKSCHMCSKIFIRTVTYFKYLSSFFSNNEPYTVIFCHALWGFRLWLKNCNPHTVKYICFSFFIALFTLSPFLPSGYCAWIYVDFILNNYLIICSIYSHSSFLMI